MTARNRLVETRKDWQHWEQLVFLYLPFIHLFDLNRLMAYFIVSYDYDFNPDLNPRYAPMDDWLMKQISCQHILTFFSTL